MSELISARTWAKAWKAKVPGTVVGESPEEYYSRWEDWATNMIEKIQENVRQVVGDEAYTKGVEDVEAFNPVEPEITEDDEDDSDELSDLDEEENDSEYYGE